MELKKLGKKLKRRLSLKLPGNFAQSRFNVQSNRPYNFDISEKDAVPSAVLILIYKKDSELQFILTERAQTLDYHKGQISLPGGSQENNEILSQTALRETHEEVGIDSAQITIIGELSPLFVPVTGFMIYPFVGMISKQFQITIDKNEVASAFSVSLNEMMDDSLEKQEKRDLRGYKVEIPYFLLAGKKVWGATAMILSEFKQIIKEIT